MSRDMRQLELDYMSNAARTLSPNFYPEKVPPIEIDMVLQAAVAIASRADRLKKAMFYGKEFRFGASFASPSSLKLEKERANLIHAILGIFTEAGELMEALLNVLTSKENVDVVNIVEELGDIEWYMAILHREFSVTPSTIKDKNIAKLKARYPEKFSENEALERDLENERRTLEG